MFFSHGSYCSDLFNLLYLCCCQNQKGNLIIESCWPLVVGKDQLTAGNQSTDDLQTKFGPIPWDDIRLVVRTDSHTDGRAKAVQSAGCRTLVSFPGEFATQPEGNPGTIATILNSLRTMLAPEHSIEGQGLLTELGECLRLTCGRQKRKGGGWQYIDSFMLDAVIFADNLRPLYDGDLMQDSVKRTLWCSVSETIKMLLFTNFLKVSTLNVQNLHT